jgi:dipeptidyl aminopeptidase/acylaminoacyl peptidase
MGELTAEMVADQLLVTAVEVSPERGWIAFAAEPAGHADEHPSGSIWLASPGDAAAPLTAGTAKDQAPRWSPDSRTLYFLSDREKRGVNQLYRINPERGEARALTSWEPGIASYLPLPDGKRVALIAADPETDEAKQRKEARDDAEVYGEDWQYHRLRLLELDSGDITTVEALGDRHIVDVVAEPDGNRLLVKSWVTPETDNAFHAVDLFVVDLDSGVANLLCHHTASVGDMCWAPDDTVVVLATQPHSFHAGVSIFTVPASGGELRELIPDLTVCPMQLVAPGNGEVLVLVEDRLDSWVGRVNVPSGSLDVVQRLPGDAYPLSASRDGSLLAAFRRTPEDVGNVWAGAPGRPWARRSDLNPTLAALDWAPHEAFSWLAPDGLALDGVLLLPAGATRDDGPFPTVISVHGGPYWRFPDAIIVDWMLWGQWLAKAGFAVFMPNPRGSSGRGPEFAKSVLGSPGEGAWADIEAGIDELVRQGVADPERLGIGGWSYGGYMTAWALGHSERFKCGIVGAGVTDWSLMIATGDIPSFSTGMGGSVPWSGPGPHQHAATSPISYAHRISAPTFIPHGAADVRVPLNQGQYLAQALREHDVPSELVVYPREDHIFSERQHEIDLMNRVRAWFERWLGAGWKPAASEDSVGAASR